MKNEEQVLDWLIHQVESDEIEDVTDEMLDMLIKRSKHLAVLFCNIQFNLFFYRLWLIVNYFVFYPDDKDEKKSVDTLAELENIDDECDQKVYFLFIVFEKRRVPVF